MNLQRFVTDVIEAIGGVVEPVEYALCQVLIPEPYQGYFQNKAELELAFDFEVAQEHPKSEFVTFGSYLLEQVLAIANQKAVNTLRFAEIEHRELADPIKKISEFFPDAKGRVSVLDEKHVMGAWAVFQFHLTFISDEKQESSKQIWINLLTNQVSTSMKQQQNRIAYRSGPLYHYPFPIDPDMNQAFSVAYNYVKRYAEEEQRQHQQEQHLQKDIDRIEAYYGDLLKENNKKATRRGQSDDKLKEIAAKTKAITVEKDKQLDEIKKKAYGHTEITLDHGIIYFIPLQQFDIDFSFRSERKRQTLYFNPITKQFDRAIQESEIETGDRSDKR
ncbi:MAG: hypothetical protein ABF629_07010 [Sporolactobacillus sp.]